MNFFKKRLNHEKPENLLKLNPARKDRRIRMIHIVTLITSLLAIILGGIGLHPVLPASPHHNIIYLENQKPGTTRWQSTALKNIQNSVRSPNKNDDAISDSGSPKASGSTWTDTTIRGYANATSINHGDAI